MSDEKREERDTTRHETDHVTHFSHHFVRLVVRRVVSLSSLSLLSLLPQSFTRLGSLRSPHSFLLRSGVEKDRVRR